MQIFVEGKETFDDLRFQQNEGVRDHIVQKSHQGIDTPFSRLAFRAITNTFRDNNHNVCVRYSLMNGRIERINV